MPTSSIFASFDIKDKQTAENFVNALEESASHYKPIPLKNEITNLDEIRMLWNKRKMK